MKRIALTLVIWLLVASAVIVGGVALVEGIEASAACVEAEAHQWFWQRFPDSLPYSSTRAAVYAEASCGVQHGVVPVQTRVQ